MCGCCYGCCISQEETVMAAVPARREWTCLPFLWLLESLSSFLACALPALVQGTVQCEQKDNWLHKQEQQYALAQRSFINFKEGPSGQGYCFSSGHVWMWDLDCEESWELKNWCFWTVVLEKTLESPLDCKEIQPVQSKGDQSWVFIGRTDAEAETAILWPPHSKSWIIGKDSDAGRDWGQEEKGTTEDEMVGWHHWLNRHEFK